MSEAGSKVYDFTTLQPKCIKGSKRNASWVYQYDRATRMWAWVVEFTVSPIIISGTAATEAEAWKAVERRVRKVVR